MNRDAFSSACASLGLTLTPAQLDQFERFEANLYETNEVINLTRVSRDQCWLRHFVDSLLFQDLIPAGSSLLDIGTGPGFPAWPIASARPDLSVIAIDSSGKMIGFLSGNKLPNLRSLQIRAEEWHMRDAFDVVTGRAVAPLGVQLELSAPLCRIGGQILAMRTPTDLNQISANVSQLGIELTDVLERRLPGTDILRVFPVYRKVFATPKRFPRTWAEMKRKPSD
jgi:16S rRNA (guanine527-N7)-methyltransferase